MTFCTLRELASELSAEQRLSVLEQYSTHWPEDYGRDSARAFWVMFGEERNDKEFQDLLCRVHYADTEKDIA
jgi:hypothetical protein